MISTGVKYLDKMTGGLKLGDNVIWQISDAVPIEYFIKAFFTGSSDFDKSIIYINFNYSPLTINKKYSELFKHQRVILIDAFTHGKGNSDPVFLDFYQENRGHDISNVICLKNPKDITSFISVLNDVQLNNKEGCFYIFDSLTGMNELWKDEIAILDFFGFTCPKLYELNTLAYWICETNAHSKQFIAGLTHITQIVFSIYKSNPDFFELNILKLEDRPSFNNTGPHPFKLIDKKIHFHERKIDDLFKIGEKLKDLRKSMNITQAELASSLGMTPGAISQIENSVISPSLHTLVQLSTAFNKPLEYFIDIDLRENKKPGYAIHLKKPQNDFNSNFAITKLAEEDSIDINPFSVTIKPNTTINGPLLLHKGMEFITITKGALCLIIDGEEKIIEKGDSILLKSSFVEKLHNRDKNECELIYILF